MTQRSVDVVLARAGGPSRRSSCTPWRSGHLINCTVVEHDDAQWQAACGIAMLASESTCCNAWGLASKTQRASIVFVGAFAGPRGSRTSGWARHAARKPSTAPDEIIGATVGRARCDLQLGLPGCTRTLAGLCALQKLPMRLEAIPVALGRRPDAAADLAGALEYLASPAGRAVTGATLCLDGGEWMVP